MPEYKAPGVYVEIQAGAPPIEPVGTSTAAFIGVVPAGVSMPDKPSDDGPAVKYKVADKAKPVLLTSFDQFLTNFGNVMPAPADSKAPDTTNSTLAHSVFGYFANGGSRCYVARVDSITSANEVNAALKELAKVDEVAVVAAPGALTKDVQDALTDHASASKYRFALIDGQITDVADAKTIKGGAKESNYTALYYPRIAVSNLDLSDDAIQRPRVTVSPLGHVAGIIARVDQAAGPHFPPANEDVRGALGLEFTFGKAEQEGVNPEGINVIRNFRGNMKVWGARTLGGKRQGEFRYVSVQRTMSMIAQSIDEGTQFAVLRPNNQTLWEQIKRSVRGFLTILWRDGALFGATADQAFYVKCDEGTTSEDERKLGRVIIEIGVAIVQPAEFVIFRLSQLTRPAA